MLVFWVIAAGIALGPALHSWIKVYEFARGKKEDPSKYVTHDQLNAIRGERDKQVAETVSAIRSDMISFKSEVKDDLDAFEKTARELLQELASLHRSLGHAEGLLDAQPSMAPTVKPSGRRRRG
jgi:hypothetical protein